MSQTVTEQSKTITVQGSESRKSGVTTLTGPLKWQGKLQIGKKIDLSPSIGSQVDLQISKLLHANDDELRDLAHLVSNRGVLFFKDQDIAAGDLERFIERFHVAAGAPHDSGLHVHPSAVNTSEFGDNIQRISSEAQKAAGTAFWRGEQRDHLASTGFHSDITFEKAPSDYSALQIVKLPESGGDTLFASQEEVYNRLSPGLAKYLEGLTAFHAGTGFLQMAERTGTSIIEGPRGSPFNKNKHLSASHPVIRTNPVTGRKAVFVNKQFTRYVEGIPPHESQWILDYLFRLVVENHDLQVRIKWDKNDLALWDNRSMLHSATFDFTGEREGIRACSVGEVPFLDNEYGQGQ